MNVQLEAQEYSGDRDAHVTADEIDRKAKMREYNRNWYRNNPDKAKAIRKRYNESHREEIKERGKAWRATHDRKEYQQAWWRDHREEVLARVCAERKAKRKAAREARERIKESNETA